MALVAAAGPISNLLMCLIAVILVYVSFFIYRCVVTDPYPFWHIWNLWAGVEGLVMPEAFSGKLIFLIFTFLMNFGMLNASLAVFNLIPVPPLDGSRIAFIFLPVKFYFGIMRYERYIQIVLWILIFAGAFDAILSFLVGGIFYGLTDLMELIPIFRFPWY